MSDVERNSLGERIVVRQYLCPKCGRVVRTERFGLSLAYEQSMERQGTPLGEFTSRMSKACNVCSPYVPNRPFTSGLVFETRNGDHHRVIGAAPRFTIYYLHRWDVWQVWHERMVAVGVSDAAVGDMVKISVPAGSPKSARRKTVTGIIKEVSA